jgi:hypothetical protein
MIKQSVQTGEMPLTLPAAMVLNPGDLVLVTFELGWLPVPCKVLEIRDSSSAHESGDLLVNPLVALTGISAPVDSPRWVFSFNCRKLDALTALQLVKASNELLSAVPTLVLDHSR